MVRGTCFWKLFEHFWRTFFQKSDSSIVCWFRKKLYLYVSGPARSRWRHNYSYCCVAHHSWSAINLMRIVWIIKLERSRRTAAIVAVRAPAEHGVSSIFRMATLLYSTGIGLYKGFTNLGCYRSGFVALRGKRLFFRFRIFIMIV